MNEQVFVACNEDILWQQVEGDFRKNPDLLEYHAVLQHDSRRVLLDIDIDPGGGFESGFATTTFSSYLFDRNNFRFAIHTENFVDEIGKFFGMKDVILGYKDFDSKFVVKTNDEAKTVLLFSDAQVRTILLSLPSLTFGIVQYIMEASDGKAPFLELRIEEGITNPAILKKIYHAFYTVLHQLG